MSNKNDLSGAYIVLDGALFTCNQGATPNSIVATNKEKVYAQNKKVITTEDITFQTPSLTFGTCLLSTNKQAGQPCVYANGEWDKKSCYDEKIVLDSSKMYCSACTPQGGEITCLYHGQQCSVSATDFANFEIESAVLFNSLLPFNELENKKSEKTSKKPSFSVNSIDLTRIKKSENTNIPIAQEEKNPKHIRPNEKLILEAKRNSKVSLEGEPVSWIIFQKETIKASTPKGKPQTKIKNLKIYPKVGTPFTIQLAKTGKYYIEAIGNGNDYKSLKSYYQMQKSLAENEWIVNKERIPLDAKCCKEIEVCANDIVRLSPQGDYPKVNSSSTSAWDLKDAKEPLFLRAENFQKSLPSNSISFVVKQNEPFVLKVDTIFELAHDEFLTVHFNNILLTYMLNKNASTSFYSFNPLTKLFTLKGLNTGDYRIRFELNCLNASSIFKPKTLGVGGLRIHCISDFLDIKTSSGETENPQNIRPGDSLQFKADSSKCKIDSSKIEWSWGKAIPKNNKKKPNKAKKEPEPEPVRTTKKCDKLIINSEKEEYRLRVDACIEDPNFLFQDMNGEKDLETAKKWSFECNVINNRIKRIWLDAEEAFVGMTYNLYTEYLYPDYIPTKDGEIKCSLNDEVLTMENGKQSLVFENPGKQQISLTMGNTETVTEEFDVYDITVEEWVFLDSEQHIIKQVGFGTKFQLSIYIPAFKYLTEKERSDIRLELWDERTGKKLETDALHNVMMDDKGHINAELTGYDLSESTDDITLSCALVNLPYHVCGLNDEKHNGHFFYAKAKKLIISEKEYINGFFAGSTGNPQKSILRYGMEAKIVLYMHNLSQSKIENCTLQLVENDDSDDLKDTLIWKSDIPKPNDDGRVEIVIPENIINEADHNAETPRIPRLFYFKVVYHNPITEELSLLLAYPAQKIGDDFKIELNEESVQKLNCNYFWQLKYALEDYVGNLNKNLGCSALTIIGEELDYGEKKKECKECLCKKYNLPYGNLLKCNERKKVVEVCKELFGEDRAIDMAQKLMICMQIETSKFSPSIVNSDSNAVGLIQFTDIAIKEINKRHPEDKTSREELLKMSFIRQMDFVKYYFEPFVKRLKIHNTALDFYLCIFWPAAVEKDDDFILCKENSEQYRQNKAIDQEKKGYICKKDFIVKIKNSIIEGEKKRRNFLYECLKIDEQRNGKYCPICGKVHLDVTSKVTFQTQYDSIFGNKAAQDISCYKACREMLFSAGLPESAAISTNQFFFAEEINNSNININDQHQYLKPDPQIMKEAISYMDEQLSLGFPVLVGVDHTYGKTYNLRKCDHFIVIVERCCSEGTICYRFYDPGTSYKEKGTSKDNILIYNEKEHLLEGVTTYNKNNYIVSVIRRN